MSRLKQRQTRDQSTSRWKQTALLLYHSTIIRALWEIPSMYRAIIAKTIRRASEADIALRLSHLSLALASIMSRHTYPARLLQAPTYCSHKPSGMRRGEAILCSVPGAGDTASMAGTWAWAWGSPWRFPRNPTSTRTWKWWSPF